MQQPQQANNGSVNERNVLLAANDEQEQHNRSELSQRDDSNNTINNKKKESDGEQNTAQPTTNYQQQVHHRSQVKTYTPPVLGTSASGSSSGGIGTTPVVSIYTKPHLMKRLKQFLDHFDRAPQQMFIDFAFVEVEENDVSQFRYKLQHPILQSIYGPTVDEQLPLYQNESTSSSARLPSSLTPRL